MVIDLVSDEEASVEPSYQHSRTATKRANDSDRNDLTDLANGTQSKRRRFNRQRSCSLTGLTRYNPISVEDSDEEIVEGKGDTKTGTHTAHNKASTSTIIYKAVHEDTNGEDMLEHAFERRGTVDRNERDQYAGQCAPATNAPSRTTSNLKTRASVPLDSELIPPAVLRAYEELLFLQPITCQISTSRKSETTHPQAWRSKSSIQTGSRRSTDFIRTHPETRESDLEQEDCYRMDALCVNKLLQVNGIIIIAGLVEGGGHNDRRSLGQNQDGNLVMYNKLEMGRWKNLPMHKTDWGHRHVNDIARDPTKESKFASSGSDGIVNIWEDFEATETCQIPPPSKFQRPLDIRFRSVGHSLAVAQSDGVVQVYNWKNLESTPMALRVVPLDRSKNHGVGSIEWGPQTKPDILWTLSEPPDGNKVKQSWFYRFDVNTGTPFGSCLNGEAGDALAVDGRGDRIALFTTTEDIRLRLIDEREQRSVGSMKYLTITRPFPKDATKFEVSRPSFTQDGILLAVPHTHNATLIYDSRFLSETRGALYNLTHNTSVSTTPHGVVAVEWIENQFGCTGRGIVTGGADGCVRLWDIRKAIDDPTNGQTIARSEHDIAHFSLGEPYTDEWPLVIGDMSATVRVYRSVRKRTSERRSNYIEL